MSENRTVRPEVRTPHANSNFLVDLGYGDPHNFSAGFCEVIFPDFRIDVVDAVSQSEQTSDAGDCGRSQLLVLRRGVTGMLDLYEWWNEARRNKVAEERTVKVTLLAEDLSPVFTWYFLRVRPVSLSYSPLNAMDGRVLIESIELKFESMEMR